MISDNKEYWRFGPHTSSLYQSYTRSLLYALVSSQCHSLTLSWSSLIFKGKILWERVFTMANKTCKVDWKQTDSHFDGFKGLVSGRVAVRPRELRSCHELNRLQAEHPLDAFAHCLLYISSRLALACWRWFAGIWQIWILKGAFCVAWYFSVTSKACPSQLSCYKSLNPVSTHRES